MSKSAGAGKNSKNGGGNPKKAAGTSPSQNAPKNARVVKSSAKTGTISRAAARAAVKAVLAEG
jgi:hypothetical protein